MSRDPIEESGGVNLYGFVGNDGVNQLDVLGLTVYIDYEGNINTTNQYDPVCCYDDMGDVVDKVKDDAGKYCCEDEVKTVKHHVRSQGRLSWRDPGHAWIETDILTIGFYPKKQRTVSDGEFKDDSALKPDRTEDYKACPQTMIRIHRRIQRDKSRPPEWRMNTYNCVSWSVDVLRSAGFDNVPNIGGSVDRPGDLY